MHIFKLYCGVRQYFIVCRFVSERKRQVVIKQTRFLSPVFLGSEFKLENSYSGANFCENSFLRMAEKIAKSRTRNNFTVYTLKIMSITNTGKTSWTKPIMRDQMNQHHRYQTDILILHFSDHYGMRGHSLAWIEAWLVNRTQQVFLMGQSWARFAFYCTLTITLAPEVRSQTTYDEIHHN